MTMIITFGIVRDRAALRAHERPLAALGPSADMAPAALVPIATCNRKRQCDSNNNHGTVITARRIRAKQYTGQQSRRARQAGKYDELRHAHG